MASPWSILSRAKIVVFTVFLPIGACVLPLDVVAATVAQAQIRFQPGATLGEFTFDTGVLRGNLLCRRQITQAHIGRSCAE